MERWSDYVRAHVEGTQREFALRVGVGESTVSRWLAGQVQPTAGQVIKFARAVGKSPIQALVMAGQISPEEGHMAVTDLGLGDLNDGTILEEIARRLAAKR